MSDRTPTDGMPFYCTECGCGYAEFLACEDGWCQLESPDDAQKRAAQAAGERR